LPNFRCTRVHVVENPECLLPLEDGSVELQAGAPAFFAYFS
jgi:hypothetical protein